MIGGVIVAALAEHDARPVLAAVRVEFAPLTLVACDGVRLALRRRGGAAPTKGTSTDAPGVTVPRRALAHLARLLRHEAGTLTLAHDPNRALLFAITAGGADWAARLIDGAYPDYQTLIPATTATTIIVQRTDLRLALRRGAAFDPQARLVRLDAHPATMALAG